MADPDLSKYKGRRYRKSVTRECGVCGCTFRIFPAWLRNGAGGFFCNRKCSAIGSRKKEKVLLHRICEECRKAFYIRKGQGPGIFCSAKCRAVSCGRKRRGEKHPFWRGGVARRSHASRMAIATAIRFAGCCERCGSTKNLHGHHIKHYSKCAEGRADRSNIKVLCAECHAREHPKQAGMLSIPKKRGGVYKKCIACGEAFYSKPHLVKTAVFCSHSCLYANPPATRVIKSGGEMDTGNGDAQRCSASRPARP